MSNSKNSICILCEIEDLCTEIETAIGKLPSVYSTRIEKPLAAVNGKASKLVSTYDALVVDVQNASPEEIDVFGHVLRHSDTPALVLALTNGNISLSEARRLHKIGIDDVLPVPFTQEELAQSIRKLLDSRRPQPAPVETVKRGRIIGVGRAAGGSGASTIATNLAIELLDRKGVFKKSAQRKVVLVDLNPQFGSIGLALDLESERGLAALAMEAEIPDANFVETIIDKHESGLDVIAGPASPVPLDALEPDQVSSLLDVLGQTYEYVVLDLPSVVVGWEEPLINRLDRLFLVSNLSVPALLHTKRMMEFFEKSSPNLDIQVVINREKKPSFGSQRAKEATSLLGHPIATWIPDDPQHARSAADVGRPVLDKHPKARMSRAIRTFAEQVRQVELRGPAQTTEA